MDLVTREFFSPFFVVHHCKYVINAIMSSDSTEVSFFSCRLPRGRYANAEDLTESECLCSDCELGNNLMYFFQEEFLA
jgi:hypothetical protein